MHFKHTNQKQLLIGLCTYFYCW